MKRIIDSFRKSQNKGLWIIIIISILLILFAIVSGLCIVSDIAAGCDFDGNSMDGLLALILAFGGLVLAVYAAISVSVIILCMFFVYGAFKLIKYLIKRYKTASNAEKDRPQDTL